MEGMRLDLIDRRYDVVVHDEIHHAVRMKVAHADRADASLAVQLLHRAPRAVDVADRLVDEVEIERLELQTLHRTVECATRLVVPGVTDPQLRGDKDLLARDAAAPDCIADRLLI